MDADEKAPKVETPDGVEIRQVYMPADGPVDYLRDVGLPGDFPFTRGIYPTMYRGRLWTMRQYAGFGTAEESNRRFRYLLGQGQTGLSIAFDLPTQMGYDSDHPMAEPEVGRVGVAIDSLLDMEVLLDGIPLDRVTTSRSGTPSRSAATTSVRPGPLRCKRWRSHWPTASRTCGRLSRRV